MLSWNSLDSVERFCCLMTSLRRVADPRYPALVKVGKGVTSLDKLLTAR